MFIWSFGTFLILFFVSECVWRKTVIVSGFAVVQENSSSSSSSDDCPLEAVLVLLHDQ